MNMPSKEQWYKWRLLAAVLALLLALIFLVGQKLRYQPPRQTILAAPVFIRQLDGIFVSTTAAARALPVAVMIDNHPEARPQSGLSLARVVYEAPVEGGLTRFLAIYDSLDSVPEVGPIRSARPYFLDWLYEYGRAPYFHSGGSPAALKILKENSFNDVNEFWQGGFFWRSANQSPPHNLYTSSNRWQEWIAKYAGEPRSWDSWQFGAATNTVLGEPLRALTIPFVSNYRVRWQYNDDLKRWQRLVNEIPAGEADGSLIFADNVLVFFIAARVLDEVGRLEISNLGQGELEVIRQGQRVLGSWLKSSAQSRTKLIASNGEAIALIPGVTWVEIVPSGLALQITN